MLAYGGDKWLTCLQKRPLSVEPAFCCFVDLTLPPQWIFFCSKNDFTLLHVRFQQIPKKTSSLSLLKDSKMLMLLYFQRRKPLLQLSWLILDPFFNLEPFFSWSVWGPSLPSLERLSCCFSYDMTKGVRFWDDLWCSQALSTSSPHHKLWNLVLSCFIIFDMGAPRDKVQ